MVISDVKDGKFWRLLSEVENTAKFQVVTKCQTQFPTSHIAGFSLVIKTLDEQCPCMVIILAKVNIPPLSSNMTSHDPLTQG